MSRGHKIIAAMALAAVVLISAGLGWLGAQEIHPSPPILYAREASAVPDQVHRAPRCTMPVDYNDAVLCAYLRQAEAAERGLEYSLFQGIITAAAVLA